MPNRMPVWMSVQQGTRALRRRTGAALAAFTLTLGLALGLLGMAPPPAHAATALPAIGDPDKVSISGISSGAAMAVQYAVAHSRTVTGVGAIAGPGWGCAQGRISQAVNACMCVRDAPPTTLHQARQFASAGAIDHLMSGKPQRLSRAFVFHSPDDATVKAAAGEVGMAFLRDFIGQPPTVDRGNASDGSDHAGHGILSPEGSDSCEAGLHDSSYVRHCGGKDNARDLLRALFPEVPFDLGQRVDDIPDSELQPFDQTPFIDEVTAASPYIAPDTLWLYFWPYRSDRRDRLDMATTGYLYVPPVCRTAGTRCGVHVALHGCKQDVKAFARTTGYKHWAQLYRLIIVYPAVKQSDQPVSESCAAGAVPTVADSAWIQPNPNGCWDWWGYLDGNDRTRYLTQAAPQMQVIERIVRALTRPQ